MPEIGDSARPNTRAGTLIRGGAIMTCLRCWHQSGRSRHSWHKVRKVMRELFPTVRTNSLEAVIRAAQGVAYVGRQQEIHEPEWAPPHKIIPDVRRLIRESRQRQ